MKKSVFVMALLFAQFSLAMDFGKTMSIAPRPDGTLQLGVQYSYQPDIMGARFELSWNILFAPAIESSELRNIPAQLQWAPYSKSAQKQLAPYQPVDGGIRFMQVAVGAEDQAAMKMIANQGDLILVFVGPQGPLYSLDIGTLCQTQSSHFVDLTNTSRKCGSVTENEILGAREQFCVEKSKELTGYLHQHVLTCETAKRQFDESGCGTFICP